jgi:hypothetical protein
LDLPHPTKSEPTTAMSAKRRITGFGEITVDL